jgi:hypothetical protein
MNSNFDTNSNLPIDLEQNSASLQINKDVYVRILTRALEQTQQDIYDLSAALPIDDFEKFQAITHRLKGDYDNMRIASLSTLAKEMNNLVRTNPDKEKLSVLLDNFKECFIKLQEHIARPQ